MTRLMTFRRLEILSFCHSAVYLVLLGLSLGDGPPRLLTLFGWLHGIGWILMSVLCILAVRQRVVPLWLAVLVAVVGGVGPFAGTIGFVLEERRERRPEGRPERGMV